MADAAPSSSSDASSQFDRPRGDLQTLPYQALLLGTHAETRASIEGSLARLGASVTHASAPDEAFARLEQEAFAFCVLADASRAEVDAIVRRTRLGARLAGLPILVLHPPRESDAALAPPSTDRGGPWGPIPSLGIVLAPRPPSEVLESQLALLVELHRARTSARDAEDQLGQAGLALSAARATNAALAEQARHATSELAAMQKQLVQAAKLAALGELVAGVAHEISNPLAFSISHLGTLRRCLSRPPGLLAGPEAASRDESGRVEERIDGIALGLDSIKSLVVKLQTFSRLDDGKIQAWHVADAIAVVLAILHHRTRDRIEVSTSFGSPAIIYCQSSLFNQCVMNLLVNAIDAVESRGAEGRIHLSARSEGDDYVLRVVDNGHGIASDIQGRIFDPFFTTKPEGKGTGLGLSIAASVVEKHGGTLALAPAVDAGTQAMIKLPLARVSAKRHPAAPSL